MKTNFLSKISQKLCRIENIWLILVTIVISLILPSCMPPRSLETGERVGRNMQKTNQAFSSGLVHSNRKKNSNKEKNIDVNVIADKQNEQILDFEEKLLKNNKNNKNSGANEIEFSSVELLKNNKNTNKSLPSLKEQMDELSQNQANIESQIDDIKDNVSEMKYLLKNIHNSKQETKSNKIQKNYDNIKHDTFIIDSDDEIDNSTLTSDEENVKETSVNKKNVSSKNESAKPVVQKTAIKVKNEKKKQAPVLSVKDGKPKFEPKEEIIKPANTNTEEKISVDENTNSNLAEKDFSNIINHVAKGDFNNAIKEINTKIKTTKNTIVLSDCQYWLGECNFKQKKYAEAINNYKYVLSGKGDKKDIAQAKLAESYMRIGKNDEARNEFQTLLKNYPKSSQTSKAKKMLQQL